MATIEKRSDGYRLVFWYRGERYQGAIKAKTEKAAKSLKARVEENLGLLQQGRIEYRDGDDLFALMISDGKLNAQPDAVKPISLGEFFAQYQGDRPPGKEGNTRYTEDIHIKHLLAHLGAKTTLQESTTKLQSYVNARSQEKTRTGDSVSHVTIKKELGTLTSLWNKWAVNRGLVKTPLSLRNLEYPKGREILPFQPWDEIERKTKGDKESPLWDCAFLTVPQVEELLEWIKANGCLIRKKRHCFPWVYPMVALCAYTGARRSEILRCRVEDIDFDRSEVTIREKKKDRSKHETYRQVPMVPALIEALTDWMQIHPGGNVTFCKSADKPFTPQMAEHYFRWAIDGSKWEVLKGWHVLRHSFISNMASHGVDQRVIMEIVGHLNEATTKRYTHLLPRTVESAMQLVFQGQRPLVTDPK